MSIVFPNWYGLNHEKVMETFEGAFTYLGTFCVKGEYLPRAVYYNAAPNRAKGHKDYMTLQGSEGELYVAGIDAKDMKKEFKQAAVKCLLCDDIIYSVNRHHCHYCSCKKIFIDGGKDYVRIGLEEGAEYKTGTINFKTGKFRVRKPLNKQEKKEVVKEILGKGEKE